MRKYQVKIAKVTFSCLFVNFKYQYLENASAYRIKIYISRKNISTYLSNKISHEFGLRWNTKPLLAHGLKTSPKSSITQRLRTDLGRSLGGTTATYLVWSQVYETNFPTPWCTTTVIQQHISALIIIHGPLKTIGETKDTKDYETFVYSNYVIITYVQVWWK